MTCVKTGCHIYIIPYGTYAYGDAHQVGDVFFFRLVLTTDDPPPHVLHYEVNGFDSWWDRGQESGAHPSTLIAHVADVIPYGYDGRDINEFAYAGGPNV